MTNRFPKSLRLCSSGQFQKVFTVRRSAADSMLLLFAAPNELPYSRLGLSVSKKIGNAVIRNRWKRLIRESFRKSQSILPKGYDFVVLPQRNVHVRTVKNLEQSLKNLTARITQRSAHKMPTVLLTRPEHQVEPVKTQLEAMGFQVLLQPAVDILPPESWQETDEAIRQLRRGEFDWIIFSSSNGVHSFYNRLGTAGIPADIQFAAVGSSTDAALFRCIGRHADVVPQTFAAEGIAEALLPEVRQGKRFLHLRASRGRDVLKRLLSESGSRVTEIAVYQSVDRIHADPQIVESMQQGRIDYVTVTSSAIARSLVHMFGGALRHTHLISISPITTKTLSDSGLPPKSEANEASLAGIVDALRTLKATGL